MGEGESEASPDPRDIENICTITLQFYMREIERSTSVLPSTYSRHSPGIHRRRYLHSRVQVFLCEKSWPRLPFIYWRKQIAKKMEGQPQREALRFLERSVYKLRRVVGEYSKLGTTEQKQSSKNLWPQCILQMPRESGHGS